MKPSRLKGPNALLRPIYGRRSESPLERAKREREEAKKRARRKLRGPYRRSYGGTYGGAGGVSSTS